MKETKNKILQAAIIIWGSDLAATLDDIANHTGISRRTLHRHYEGREDLMKSVLNYIIEKYLEYTKDLQQNTSSDQECLKKLLEYDIKSGSVYKVFCQLRRTNYTEFETDDENFKELYAFYIGLFGRLRSGGQIRNELSIQWLETFYMAIVESCLGVIDSGVDEKECMHMTWTTLWNGIKS